jgi:hypothetical protein
VITPELTHFDQDMVVWRNGIQKNLFQPFILMEKRALLHQTLLVETKTGSLYLRALIHLEIVSTDYRPWPN